MEWNTYQNLKFIEKRTNSASSAVILFHGYGADATDLAPFSQTSDASVDWYFPQGVLDVPVGPMMSGKAWFSLENRNWEALQRGEIDNSAFTPQILGTLQLVVDFLNDVGKRYEKVVIGGFSQGAILTSHAFYRTQFSPAGLVLLSGYLVSPGEFVTLSPMHQGTPFFQSHGRQDQVLPLEGAKKLRAQMASLGLKGDLQVFQGGHEIPLEIQKMMMSFIQNRLE